MNKKQTPSNKQVSGGHTVGQKYFDNQTDTVREKKVNFETYDLRSHFSHLESANYPNLRPNAPGWGGGTG